MVVEAVWVVSNGVEWWRECEVAGQVLYVYVIIKNGSFYTKVFKV